MARNMCVSLFLVVTFAALQTGTAGAPCSDGGECTWQAKDNILLQMGSLTATDVERHDGSMQEVAESESQDEAKEGETSEETAEGESTEEATEEATVLEKDTATEQEASTGCVLGASHTSGNWVNGWDNALSFNCPSGAISRLMSHHDNRKEDRQWKFGCSSLCTSLSHGIQSGWVNNWDGPEDYTCPANFVMTGMYSEHDNRKEDRRWRITCSKVVGGSVNQGPWSHDWANGWDGAMDRSCPSDQVLIGLYSEHDNRKEDRRFKMKCGQVVKAQAPGQTIGRWIEIDWGNGVVKKNHDSRGGN